jgi:hypothetical protein
MSCLCAYEILGRSSERAGQGNADQGRGYYVQDCGAAAIQEASSRQSEMMKLIKARSDDKAWEAPRLISVEMFLLALAIVRWAVILAMKFKIPCSICVVLLYAPLLF